MTSEVKERFFAYKNLIAISLTNWFAETAILPVLNVQTSLFSKSGLGSIGLSSLFLGTVFGSIFSTVLSSLLGYVKIIAMAIALTFLYLLANLYGTLYTLIPAGLIAGYGFGILTTITATYVKDLSRRYASSIQKSEEEIFSKFYPLYFSVFKLGQISGNILVSVILKLPTTISEKNEARCGPDFCPSTDLPKENVDVSYMKLLTMVLSVCGVMSAGLFIVIVFLDDINTSESKQEKSKLELIILPLKALKDVRIILLTPLIFMSGIQIGFIYADFTEAYVTCYMGVDMVGWAMCVFGLSSFIFATFYSYICKYVGAYNILVCTGIAHLTFFGFLLNWSKFNTHVFYPYLICATAAGACDSAWRSMLPVLIRDVFKENLNEIFSLVYCLLHVGFCVAFLYGPILCIKTKIYINSGFIMLGLILAGIVHIHNLRGKRGWHRVGNE